MDGQFDRSRLAFRVFCALVYVGASIVWALFMLLVAVFTCDETCVGPDASDWTDNPDAWQWSAIGWLGLLGLVLALVAVAGGAYRRRLGVAALVAHGAVFAVTMALASPATNGLGGAVLVPALIVWALAVAAVTLRVRSEPSAPRGESRATS